MEIEGASSGRTLDERLVRQPFLARKKTVRKNRRPDRKIEPLVTVIGPE